MLYHIIYPLAKTFGFINVFGYITFRSVLAFLITFLLCVLVFPFFIKKMVQFKVNQIVRKEGPQSHQIKVGTPTMGGFLVIIGMVTSLLICGNFNNFYVLIILFATISFGVVGFFDDYLKITRKSSDGLHAKFKLFSQIFLATAISTAIYLIMGNDVAYISVPFFKNLKIYLSYFYIPFGVFWIVGFSNAVNLTDGLDGLAGGLLVPVVLTMGLFVMLSDTKSLPNIYISNISQCLQNYWSTLLLLLEACVLFYGITLILHKFLWEILALYHLEESLELWHL